MQQIILQIKGAAGYFYFGWFLSSWISNSEDTGRKPAPVKGQCGCFEKLSLVTIQLLLHPNHLLYTQNGWKQASRLVKVSLLFLSTLQWQPLVKKIGTINVLFYKKCNLKIYA